MRDRQLICDCVDCDRAVTLVDMDTALAFCSQQCWELSAGKGIKLGKVGSKGGGKLGKGSKGGGKSRGRSKSRSKSRKGGRSKSRSKSRKGGRSKSRSKSKAGKSRSRSRGGKSRSKSKAGKSRSRSRGGKSRSRSRSKKDKRGKSRSRSKKEKRGKKDKKRKKDKKDSDGDGGDAQQQQTERGQQQQQQQQQDDDERRRQQQSADAARRQQQQPQVYRGHSSSGRVYGRLYVPRRGGTSYWGPRGFGYGYGMWWSWRYPWFATAFPYTLWFPWRLWAPQYVVANQQAVELWDAGQPIDRNQYQAVQEFGALSLPRLPTFAELGIDVNAIKYDTQQLNPQQQAQVQTVGQRLTQELLKLRQQYVVEARMGYHPVPDMDEARFNWIKQLQ